MLEGIREGELYQVNLSRSVGSWARVPLASISDCGDSVPLPMVPSWLSQGSHPVEFTSDLLEAQERVAFRSRAPAHWRQPGGAALSAALEASEKERSELTMIVDLMRSDLARVSEPRSLHTSSREVHALPTLQHAWQRVEAQLRPDLDALDLLAATFPPGSVTGAPKVKAMEWIHRLEPRSRGAYTGAIGYFADGGDACLSVAIRIAQLRGQRARVHAGSGLVLDSSPDSELRESELKMVALRRAFLGEEGV